MVKVKYKKPQQNLGYSAQLTLAQSHEVLNHPLLFWKLVLTRLALLVTLKVFVVFVYTLGLSKV